MTDPNEQSEQTPEQEACELPCVYCARQIAVGAERCPHCKMALSDAVRGKAASTTGDWFLFDPRNPAARGVNIEALRGYVDSGRLRNDSIVRGPSTDQEWRLADRAPVISKYLGLCWSCQATVKITDVFCPTCKRPTDGRLDAAQPKEVYVAPSAHTPIAGTVFGSETFHIEQTEDSENTALQQVQQALADATARQQPINSRASQTGNFIMVGSNVLLGILVIILAVILFIQKPATPGPNSGSVQQSQKTSQAPSPYIAVAAVPRVKSTPAEQPTQPTAAQPDDPRPDWGRTVDPDPSRPSIFDFGNGSNAWTTYKRNRLAKLIGEAKEVENARPRLALARFTAIQHAHQDKTYYPPGFNIDKQIKRLRNRIAATSKPKPKPKPKPQPKPDGKNPALTKKAANMYAAAKKAERNGNLAMAYRKLQSIEKMDAMYWPPNLKTKLARVWKKKQDQMGE